MNTEWGFCGAHGESAWEMAHEKIMAAINSAPQVVALFLDSRFGRQFADDVSNELLTTPDMASAIDAAVTKWMGWSISKATEGQYGIPAGLPYLTGFVCHMEVTAD
jgi:hypothetical protein